MNIPFSPPYIDKEIEDEVLDSLRSGWITTGPKVRDLELLSAKISEVQRAVCVNSWTSGAALVLKWLGIGPGDEVIVPAYTYSATALTVLHAGAKPVMVDVLEDFTIDPEQIKKAITPATKAVMAVDIAGWPCNYSAIRNILSSDEVKKSFIANSEIQKQFGRPALIADAAHSLGALYGNRSAAIASDITIFSLHAVKNVTTAEGGVICLNLPAPFDNEEVYKWMKLNSLNGQTKDAFTKNQGGGWRYDIVSQGLKINMPDVCAAIGLAQLKKYPGLLLPERERVFDHYAAFFSKKDWAVIPPSKEDGRKSSFHLFPLRIKNITEEQRDTIIQKMTDAGVATNVHFIPMPMLSLFKNLGYKIEDFPQAYKNYAHEISLPIYPQLTNEQCNYIEEQIEKAYLEVI
ncbi:MAG TPA: DegT/DnrJ/EryC1/StrS family aminotransferase [Flavipsychrobacter sp.]|nr:DegT/DnrJ/EryC1/StrS family aminotransferase [Flavipsychrobacter sp.]